MSSLLFLAVSVLPHAALALGKTALLVIDVQDCFLEAACTTSGSDGSLAVPGCDVIEQINAIRAQKSCLYDEVIFSQDFHPAGHISFASSHGLAPFAHLGGKGALPLLCTNPSSGRTTDGDCCPTVHVDPSLVDCTTQLCPPDTFSYEIDSPGTVAENPACQTCRDAPDSCFATTQAMWTDHCLQSGDSTFPPTLDRRDGDATIQVGTNRFVDAYSAFMDNTKSLKTELDDKLFSKGITHLIVTGIATDYCVQGTVLDALSDLTHPYTVTLVQDATAPVQGNIASFNTSVALMKSSGATIVTTADVLAMECPTNVSCPASCKPASHLARRRLLFASVPSCPDGCEPM